MEELAQIASETIGVPDSVHVISVKDGEASFAVKTSKDRMFVGLYPATTDGARAFGKAAVQWTNEK